MVIAKMLHNCRTELHDAKLRATPARLALMNLLEKANKPLDVQEMITHLNKMEIKTDPATVFRIVNMFSDKGLVKTIELHEGKFRYELASRPEHHHFLCTNCGMIEDISDCNVRMLEEEIEKRKQIRIMSHSLEFFGICSDCQK